jgi:hypothetical protein
MKIHFKQSQAPENFKIKQTTPFLETAEGQGKRYSVSQTTDKAADFFGQRLC